MASDPTSTSMPETMRAVVIREPGGPEVLEVSGDARNTAPTLGTTMTGSEILTVPINGRD